MNEEAIAYWEKHGTVPSPEQQQATLTQLMQQNTELQAQIAALQTQLLALQTTPAKRTRNQPKPVAAEQHDAAMTSGETKAINASALATTKRLMARPELAGLPREQVCAVVEAYQQGLSSRKIREALGLSTSKYNSVLKPVVAALNAYGSDVNTLPTALLRSDNGNKKTASTHGTVDSNTSTTQRQRADNVAAPSKPLSATRQRKLTTQE